MFLLTLLVLDKKWCTLSHSFFLEAVVSIIIFFLNLMSNYTLSQVFITSSNRLALKAAFSKSILDPSFDNVKIHKSKLDFSNRIDQTWPKCGPPNFFCGPWVFLLLLSFTIIPTMFYKNLRLNYFFVHFP